MVKRSFLKRLCYGILGAFPLGVIIRIFLILDHVQPCIRIWNFYMPCIMDVIILLPVTAELLYLALENITVESNVPLTLGQL